MKVKCKVIRIEEQDFGCEGLPDGQVPMVTVILETEHKEKLLVKEKDSRLYELDINEGDEVWMEDGVIGK